MGVMITVFTDRWHSILITDVPAERTAREVEALVNKTIRWHFPVGTVRTSKWEFV